MSGDDNDQDKTDLGQFGRKAGGVADFEYEQARKLWKEVLAYGIQLGQILVHLPEPLRTRSEKEVQALVDLLNEDSIFAASHDEPVTVQDLFELDDVIQDAQEKARQMALEAKSKEAEAMVEGALDLHDLWNSCYDFREQRVNEIMLHTLMQEKGYKQTQIQAFKTRMLELEEGRRDIGHTPPAPPSGPEEPT